MSKILFSLQYSQNIMNKLTKEQRLYYLLPYHDGARFLEKAEVQYPKSSGYFKQDLSPYTVFMPQHLNAADAIICYNQLAILSIGEAIRSKQLEEIITHQEYTDNIGQHLITKIKEFKFRKQINPQKGFYGEILFETPKRIRNTYFIPTSFQFEQNSVEGKILLAVNTENLLRRE